MRKHEIEVIVMRNIKKFMAKNISMFKKNTKKINDIWTVQNTPSKIWCGQFARTKIMTKRKINNKIWGCKLPPQKYGLRF